MTRLLVSTRTVEWSFLPALGPRASVPCAASKSSAPSRPRLHGVSVSGLGCYESFFLSVSHLIVLIELSPFVWLENIFVICYRFIHKIKQVCLFWILYLFLKPKRKFINYKTLIIQQYVLKIIDNPTISVFFYVFISLCKNEFTLSAYVLFKDIWIKYLCSSYLQKQTIYKLKIHKSFLQAIVGIYICYKFRSILKDPPWWFVLISLFACLRYYVS